MKANPKWKHLTDKLHAASELHMMQLEEFTAYAKELYGGEDGQGGPTQEERERLIQAIEKANAKHRRESDELLAALQYVPVVID